MAVDGNADAFFANLKAEVMTAYESDVPVLKFNEKKDVVETCLLGSGGAY